MTVAWGNAAMERSTAQKRRLAEGQTHLWQGLKHMNLAFGQKCRCPPKPEGVKQPKLRTGLKQEDTCTDKTGDLQARQPAQSSP